jgi:dinuclear metal center YbgI/SA1388 family protein
LKLSRIVKFLDDTLDIRAIPNDSSLNGLQVEASREVDAITLAVDACEESIRIAARRRSGLLIVHHGLFWGAQAPVTGIMASRIRLLMEKKVSLYACHLPLDCHPEIGNNARLCSLLGVHSPARFGEYHGIEIGLCGRLGAPMNAASFAAKVRRVTGAGVRSFAFGPPKIGKIAVVSGGGASLLEDAWRAGCDAMLTGETSHSAFHAAREYGINLFCAGHYATETFGVRALGGLIESKLGLRAVFADAPTGL